MKKEILKWFASGCDIEEGIRLLGLYSKNKNLVRMVKLNPGKSLEWMVRELSRLADINQDDLRHDEQATPLRSLPVRSFRDEFPFLNSPECPMELKALVTDKFSTYYRYRDLHGTLENCTSLSECADHSRDIIDSYLENRSIWAELDYYKQHHSILGKHPIFKHFHKVAALRRLSIKDLVLQLQKLQHNIWRIESEIEKGDKPHLLGERQSRLEQKKAELAEVNRLLG